MKSMGLAHRIRPPWGDFKPPAFAKIMGEIGSNQTLVVSPRMSVLGNILTFLNSNRVRVHE